jgi:hypothetical protein
MSGYQIVVGRFQNGDSEMFSVVQTNNVEEFSPVDRGNLYFDDWAEMVYFTFSKGRFFLNEDKAALDAYSLSKEVCLSVIFVDFGDSVTSMFQIPRTKFQD